MRGADRYNERLFTTARLEDVVPANRPFCPIRTWINGAPANMDAKFSAMVEADVKGGRPSIAPENLMRAMLLPVLYSVRSERQLVEQIQCKLLFRWFKAPSADAGPMSLRAAKPYYKSATARTPAETRIKCVVRSRQGGVRWSTICPAALHYLR